MTIQYPDDMKDRVVAAYKARPEATNTEIATEFDITATTVAAWASAAGLPSKRPGGANGSTGSKKKPASRSAKAATPVRTIAPPVSAVPAAPTPEVSDLQAQVRLLQDDVAKWRGLSATLSHALAEALNEG